MDAGNKYSYEISKYFKCSPENLFHAFTDKATLKKIWGLSEITMDARKGGKAEAKLQIGNENWDYTLTYTDFVPHEKLSWEVRFERMPDKVIKAKCSFTKQETGTLLKMRQWNFENEQEWELHKASIEKSLQMLEEILI